MSDFPEQSEHPRVAWSKTIKSPTASSVAPGPPQTQHNLPRVRSKVSKKLAAQLEGLSPDKGSPDKSSSRDMSYSNGVKGMTVESLSAAVSKGDMDSWDPMSFDHQSRTFNSYEDGPGALMQSCKESSTKTINLYVGRIPAAITKEGLRNLFSRAGKVNRVYLQKAKTGQDLTFGFVEFSSVREADSAIQQMDNFDMGNGIHLVVKVSETPEHREARLAKEREEEEFLSTLHSAKNSSNNQTGHSSGFETEQNPLIPRYRSLAQISPEKPKPAVDNSVSARQALFNSSGGAASLRAMSGFHNNANGEKSGRSLRVSKSPSVKSSDSSSKSGSSPCHVCQLPTLNRCSLCKTPYCDQNCQKKDWPKHQSECQQIQHGVSSNPFSLPSAPRPSTPPDDELIANLEEDSDIFFPDMEDEKLKSLIASIRSGVSEPGMTGAEGVGKVEPRPSINPTADIEIEEPKTPVKVQGSSFSADIPSQQSVRESIGVPLHDIIAQLDSMLQPLPSISLANGLPKEFPAIVTDYRDATHFSVIIASMETKQTLSKLQSFGRECKPVYTNVLHNSICGYLDQSHNFYRLQVITAWSDKSAVVNFYDFGYKSTLPTSSLFGLPEEIVSIPCLRQVCSLNKMKPLQTDTGGRKYLKSLVDQKPVMVKVMSTHITKFFSILCCMITSFDGKVDILEKLRTSSYCSSLTRTFSDSVSPAKSPPVTNQAVGSTNSYKLVHLSHKVDFHCPPLNETVTIVPKVITNPSKIWAQVMHANFSSFLRMQSDINTKYQSTHESSYAPSVGEMCVAKFSQDQCYYRAEVLCVNNNQTVDIRFVDLGNRDTVSVQQIHYMMPVFLTLPKQGVLFSLAGIVPVNSSQNWDEASVVFLRDKMMNRRVQIKVLSSSSACFHAEIYDPENPILTINDTLVHLGHARSVQGHTGTSPPSTPTLGNIVGVSVKSPTQRLTGVSGTNSQIPSRPLLASPQQACSPKNLPLLLTPDRDSPTLPALTNGTTLTGLLTPPSSDSSSSSSDFDSTVKNSANMSLMTPSQFKTSATASPEKTKSANLPLKQAKTTLKSPTTTTFESFTNTRRETKAARSIRWIELPEGDSVIKVQVTQVTSPLSFWVQVLSDRAISKFMSLVRTINKMELVQSSSVSAGDLCLCRFSEDNQVHRARVTSIEDSSVAVTYIDYGNSETVSIADLYEINSDLLSIKQQAVLCTINQLLNPRGKGCEWAQETIDFFKQHILDSELEMKVVKCMGLKHVVELFVKTSSGKRNMKELLIEGGHCQSKAPRDSNSRKLNSGGFAQNKQFKTSSPEEVNRNFAVKSSPIKPIKKLAAVESLPLASELKKLSFPSEPFQLLVSEVCSPVELFVQLATSETAEDLGKLSTDLNSRFQSSPLRTPPNKGSLCCAKFSDQCWYRAEVLTSSSTSSEVRFIDYGNKETVDLKNMTLSPKEYLSIPCCALQCGLDGVQSPNTDKDTWPVEATQFLKQATADKLMKAKVAGTHPVSKLPLLKLKDAAVVGKGDVTSELIKLGYALTSTAVVPSPLSSPSGLNSSPVKPIKKLAAVESLPLASELKKLSFPSEPFQLLVSEVCSPVELFVQLATSETAEDLDKLSTDLNSRFQSSPPSPLRTPPNKGSLCCAKFSDQCWYRAEVLTSSSTSSQVRFIDYGNKETVDLKNMTLSPKEYLSIPCCALQCGLDGVQSPNTDKDTWPVEATQFLKQATADKLMKAKVAGTHPVSKLPLLKLKDAAVVGKGDVTSELIKLGYALTSTAVVPSPLSSPSGLNSSPVKPIKKLAAVESLPLAFELKKLSFPSEPFQLLVSEVCSPVELFVQLATSETAEDLDKLSTDLNSRFQSSPPIPLRTPPNKGSLCCAKFSDQCWYRAEVLTSSSTSSEVRFIDYGNKETVDLKNMTVSPKEYLSIPCCALQCGLDGVQSPNTDKDTWPVEATQFLKQATADKLMKAKVAGTHPVNKLPLLKLKDAVVVGKGDVTSELIKLGHALTSAAIVPSPLSSPSGLRSSPVKPMKMQAAVKSPIKETPPPVLPQISDLKNNPLPTEPFQMHISDVTSPHEFCIQLATQEVAMSINYLSADMNTTLNASSPKPFSVSPAKGSVCCAKFSEDGLFYRVEVVKSSSSECGVYFIDYGNKETVKLADLVPCPSQFVSVPICAIKCALENVNSPNADPEKWPEQSIDFMKQVADDNHILDALFSGKHNSNCYPLIDITQPSGENLADEFVKRGLAKSLTVEQKVIPVAQAPAVSLPKVSVLKRPILPTAVDGFQVLVSEVIDPNAMFVQLATEQTAEMLNQLSTGLNSFFKRAPPSSLTQPPAKGSLCCAQYAVDGDWYRAEVIETSQSTAKVCFVDFGNTETISFTELAPCPDEFVSVSICATMCSLDGVKTYCDDGESWSAKAIDYLKHATQENVLTAKCVGAHACVPVIQLKDDNGVSLGEDMIKCGFALPSQPLSMSGSPTTTSRVQNSKPAPSPSSTPAVVISKSALPSGIRMSVKVVDIVDPSSFCIQKNDRSLILQLDNLMTEIQSAYSTPAKYSSYKPSAGGFCCAKFSTDQCFYRCVVIRVLKSSALVRFVDFGNTVLVPNVNIYLLDSSFATLPSCVTLCSIDNIKSSTPEGWTVKAIELFKDLISDEQDSAVTAVVSDKPSKEAVSLQLYLDEGCSHSVAEFLVQSGCAVYLGKEELAVPSPSAGSSMKATESAKAETKVSSSVTSSSSAPAQVIPFVTLPSTTKFPVLITHVSSFTEFYIQIATQESLQTQMKIMEGVHTSCTKAKPVTSTPKVGEFYFAQYDGDSWFRAQVIKCVDDEVFQVLFIDFGNKENVTLFEMKSMPTEFLSYPMQAIPCGLYGVPSSEALRPEKSLDAFKSLVSMDSISTCKVVSTDPLLVDFEDSQGFPALSICDKLRCKGIFPKISDLGMSSLETNRLPLKESTVVIVTEVTHPGDFWLQVVNQSIVQDFEKLTMKIQDHCKQAASIEASPVLGQLVCAMFSHDGVWYRAKVMEIVSQTSFRVRFIDFGNSEVTGASKIRPFRQEFMHLPAQAVRCSLVEFSGKSTISDAVTEHFQKLVENQQLIAIHRGVRELNVKQVELIDTSGNTDVYVHQELK